LKEEIISDAIKTMTPDGLLTNLNQSQHAAVSSFADTLAILAGPGSGKTHTLTSRTAWLLAQGLQPWNVIVATFTVKAAREMKERIGKLLGNGLESKLILGTFHSIARRYLARYGHLIGIKKDFGIADSADSLAIIKRICKRHQFILEPKVARSRISGRKARGNGYGDEAAAKPAAKSVEAQEFETCYAEYEAALQRSSLLDYDDLLLRCVDLLRKHPSCVSNVEAVLIDEFQDTNVVQFDLMRLFAAEKKRITIVGDPDQSIYGFRAAEIKNYKRMLHQYPDTITIALEENYRSSGAILLTALSVIEQDSSRVAKSLMPTHTVGTRPVLRRLYNAHREAEWIIAEIQRCMGLTGGLLDLNDIAILLRSASLSRLIESALGKSGIAYRMVGGLRFYDRVEVKTILDYLRVINQPDNNDALSRIINIPSRRIGEATIKGLLEEADALKITLWSLILDAVQGKRTFKTKPGKSTEKGLSEFVNIILTARNKMADSDPEQRLSTVGLINFICKKTGYENWLKEHHADQHGARWDNVQELITQAGDFQDMVATGYEDESLPEIDGLEQDEESDHLSRFLANVALASEVKQDDEGTATAQVTISTIHAAKGLEWPVVFIPATYQGSIPHSRSEDTNEERRLLYVAMTRAKSLLYMSIPLKNSQGEETTLSPFLSPPSLAPLLDQKGPSLQLSTIQSISQILRRPLPSAEAISESSLSLNSTEDDLFPVEGEEGEKEKEERWKRSGENPTFTMGQRPAKKQRIELGRSASNIEESKVVWEASYTTTMERASSFTTGSFTTASHHLQILSEQSVNCSITKTAEAKGGKVTTKFKDKGIEGQGTLFGFLGKSDPRSLKRSAPDPIHAEDIEVPNLYFTGRNINQARPQSIITEPTSISPALATHRLGAGGTSIRPRQALHADQQKRNDYVFLSSSPPRPKAPTTEPEVIVEKSSLDSKQAPLIYLRPPVSMHTTSLTTVQQTTQTSVRTLGVKRSMAGWSSQQSKGKFKPPTMNKRG
jgi:DNA helicase-2/ATP-dependent DNA helicase PcrA